MGFFDDIGRAFEKVGKAVHREVVQPIHRDVVKPAVKVVEKEIVRPVVRDVVAPVAKTVDKEIVKPVVRDVIKPAVVGLDSAGKDVDAFLQARGEEVEVLVKQAETVINLPGIERRVAGEAARWLRHYAAIVLPCVDAVKAIVDDSSLDAHFDVLKQSAISGGHGAGQMQRSIDAIKGHQTLAPVLQNLRAGASAGYRSMSVGFAGDFGLGFIGGTANVGVAFPIDGTTQRVVRVDGGGLTAGQLGVSGELQLGFWNDPTEELATGATPCFSFGFGVAFGVGIGVFRYATFDGDDLGFIVDISVGFENQAGVTFEWLSAVALEN